MVMEIVQTMEDRDKNLGLSIGHLRDLAFVKTEVADNYYYSYFKGNRVIIKLNGRYGLLIYNLEWNKPPNINQSAILETRKVGRWVLYFSYGGVLK
jgi:hypothetical protein